MTRNSERQHHRTSDPIKKNPRTLPNSGSKSDSEVKSSGIRSPNQLMSPSTKSNQSLLQVALNKTIDVQSLGSNSDAGNSDSDLGSDTEPVKTQRPALSRCPCGGSSGGKAWLLKCTSCSQNWHNSCANLKGKLEKSVIAQLDHWQCPWCFTSPYICPPNHNSRKNTLSLTDTVVVDSVVTKIEESFKSSFDRQSGELLSEIRKDLDKFTESMKNHTGQQQQQVIQPQALQFPQNHPEPEVVESIREDPSHPNIPRCSRYTENFLSEDSEEDLMTFLDQQEFVAEGNRKVLSYGERYHYKGAKASETPIPEIIQTLIGKVKEAHDLSYEINQVLVNKYDPSANLPSHSDNEGSIRPDSSIFTISLGAPGKIEFTKLNGQEKSALVVEPRSLYVMSRDSQNLFKHEVLQNPAEQIRYSITLRSVHWTHYNSTFAVGDSNFGHIQFGIGRGKLGAATPGVREFAAKVEDIDPMKCISYRNVVLMCGTNNLKKADVDVLKTYKTLKGKVEQIRELNPKGNIFVCPVLPSRDKTLNGRINNFNHYIIHDLQRSDLKVNIVMGFQEFADYRGFLKENMHDKRNATDTLHINDKGYCVLVKLIKQAIFGIKKNKLRVTAGRSFANVISNT